MATPLLWLRSLVFYIGFGVTTFWFGTTSLLIFWLPYRIRAAYILLWNRLVVWWLMVCCGINFKVTGLNCLNERPMVIVSNHQSNWETFFLQQHFRPVATILKHELLNLPFFGWGLRQMRPIAIDRGSPKESMRQMLRQGKLRLDQGLSVLVFPEGTRKEAGSPIRFARGGAGLAVYADVDVLPVAHNAGYFWPNGQFIKRPGTIEVAIGPILKQQGHTAAELNKQAKEWVENALAEMDTAK
ncbi:MAG: lysophospholipid acyltransferase family protein [Pseudomonadales bacterium]